MKFTRDDGHLSHKKDSLHPYQFFYHIVGTEALFLFPCVNHG